MIGIYKIENKVNGKVYIGQSININKRWIEHKSNLNNNRHHNRKLQNAWNNYGQDNFDFSVLEECSDNINEREIYWIKYYKSADREFGYNLSTGGENTNQGTVLTEEQKAYMSSVWNPEEIVQLDFEGNLVEIWRSASYASRQIGVNISGIMRCLRHEGCYAYGYIWLYKTEYDLGFDINQYKWINKTYFEIPILQYDLYGNFIKKWHDFQEIEVLMEYDKAVVRECCNNPPKTYKNYIWLYELDTFELSKECLLKCRLNTHTYKVEQYTLDGNFVRIWTHNELVESDFNISAICSNCTNYSQTYSGYIWRYEGDDSKIIDAEFCKKATKRKTKKVYQFYNNKLIKIYDSAQATSEDGYKWWNVKKCCQYKQESYCDYIWRYEEDVV